MKYKAQNKALWKKEEVEPGAIFKKNPNKQLSNDAHFMQPDFI